LAGGRQGAPVGAEDQRKNGDGVALERDLSVGLGRISSKIMPVL
jgi:hypothetical protein